MLPGGWSPSRLVMRQRPVTFKVHPFQRERDPRDRLHAPLKSVAGQELGSKEVAHSS